MQEIAASDLHRVSGGESFSDVRQALKQLPDVPLDQTYQQTTDFIASHPFFHRGVMNAPIGGGKHFRNVPFVGPGRMLSAHNADEFAKGWAVTRATWNAP